MTEFEDNFPHLMDKKNASKPHVEVESHTNEQKKPNGFYVNERHVKGKEYEKLIGKPYDNERPELYVRFIYNHNQYTGLQIHQKGESCQQLGLSVAHENPEINKKLQRALKVEKLKSTAKNLPNAFLEALCLVESKIKWREHEDMVEILNAITNVLPEHSDGLKKYYPEYYPPAIKGTEPLKNTL